MPNKQQTLFRPLLRATVFPSIVSALMLPAFSVGTSAQETILDEIVVTSQKREQSLQDVGIAVTAFSGSQIDRLGLEDSVELVRFTPGVSMAGDIGGQRALFAIRGVVQNDFADHAEAPVAVYIDEGYLASTQAQTFGLFDVERVEILKGPQGTLFGRNATGGLVHSITRKPTEETEGYFEAGYASFNNYRVEAAVGGPLGDKVRARVSTMYNKMGEILENVYDGTDALGNTGTPGGGEDGYNDDTFAIRGQLEFDLNEDATLWISANYARTIKSEGPYQGVGTVAVLDAEGRHVDTLYSRDVPSGCEALSAVDGSCINLFADGDTDGVRPVVGGDLFGYIDPDGSGNLTSKDFAFDDENRLRSTALTAKLTYDLDWSTLTAITDYKDFSRSISLDSDQSPTPLALFQSEGDIEQFSQEIRLDGETDRVNWVAGVYYLKIDTDVTQGLSYPENSPFLVGFPQQILGLDGVVFGPFEDNTTGLLRTDSFSAFGQLDYAFSDQLTLTMGARLILEEKDYDQTIGEFNNTDDRLVETEVSTGFVPREPFSDSTSDTLWSGKIQLDYRPNDDVLLYAGINRGVKAGSFNAKLFDGVTLSDAEIPYDEEVLMAYEVGFKMDMAEGRMRLNGAAFWYDYDGFQAFTWQNNSGFVTNNDAEYKGFELELFANPTEGLDIIAGLSYTDAQVFDVEVAPGILRDVIPSFTPKWQASGIVRYSWAAYEGTMAAQASANYQSSVYHNLRNFTAQRFDGYTVVDAQLSWEEKDGNWLVTAYVDNLNNSDHRVIGFDVSSFGGYTQESFAKPRTWGLTVRRSF